MDGRKNHMGGKVLYSLGVLILFVSIGFGAGVSDTPFVQEYHEAFPLDKGDGNKDVRAIAIDRTGDIWAGTRAGVFRVDRRSKQWMNW